MNHKSEWGAKKCISAENTREQRNKHMIELDEIYNLLTLKYFNKFMLVVNICLSVTNYVTITLVDWKMAGEVDDLTTA